ncbi:MAG: cation diffusion facilitator family transporter [Candidatus Sumerlaeaceae bacterium]|nr:cation diffusion facilitator family transporter [Candidatus Sumerlaeaceae bacterium]
MTSRVYNPRVEERNRAVIHVIWITLALNWSIAGIKIAVGLIAGSMTVLADGFHAIIDGTNNVLGIVALKLASKPADEEHPYGHHKFENVAAMIIGGLIFVIGWEVTKEVFAKLYHVWKGTTAAVVGEGPRFEWTYVVLLLLTLGANVAISTYEWRAGKRLQSSFLVADAMHTRSDIVVTAMGLLSLALGATVWWLDSLLAVCVVGFIFYAGWCILRENMDVFTDRVRLNPVDVRAVVDAVPGVLNTHAIRSHGTATSVHLDLHIVIPESSTAKEAEDIESRVRQALLEHFPNISFVSIHHQTHAHDEAVPLWADHEVPGQGANAAR